MSITFLTTALLTVSLLTNLTVEAIKKLLDGANRKYSSNLLAAIMSIVITIGVSAVYIIMNDITLSCKIGVEVVVIIYLSFLTSTVGYDKVIQMINQLSLKE